MSKHHFAKKYPFESGLQDLTRSISVSKTIQESPKVAPSSRHRKCTMNIFFVELGAEAFRKGVKRAQVVMGCRAVILFLPTKIFPDPLGPYAHA